MNRDRDTDKQIKKLITMGKQKGYVTYDEVNDHMPENVVSSDAIDDWLGALGDEGIEVVVLDHGLPDMDGIRALERIREVRPDLPVIMLTGFNDARRALRCA